MENPQSTNQNLYVLKQIFSIAYRELTTLYDEEELRRIPEVNIVQPRIAGVILGASGSGKTTLAKLIALRGGFSKVVAIAWTRQYRDLQLIHGKELEYIEPQRMIEYLNSGLELDYLMGHTTLIIVEDFNRTVEVLRHNYGYSWKRVMEEFTTLVTNIRKYAAKLIIIAHDISELKPILDHMGAAATIDTWILSRLAISPQRARSIEARLGLKGLAKALLEARTLEVGEYIAINRDGEVSKFRISKLPSHDAIERARTWVLVEADIRTKKDMIIFLKKRYPQLTYKQIARLTGFSEKYCSKIVSIVNKELKAKKKGRRGRAI